MPETVISETGILQYAAARSTVAVVIITFNEEKKIEDCLRSVDWADEVIVVDSFSTDRTVEIARRYTRHVYQREFNGFGAQKAFAVLQATSDWILSLDADERVTTGLRNEIRRVLPGTTASAFRIPMDYYFPNGKKRHRGFLSNCRLRLFRRESHNFTDRLVHEGIEVEKTAPKLKGRIDHYPCYSVKTILDKVDKYSTLGAEMRYATGQRTTCLAAMFKSLIAFYKTYLLGFGFLDGWRGLLIAYSDGTIVFYKYIKCLELQDGPGEQMQSSISKPEPERLELQNGPGKQKYAA